ncbi:hypothetical protein MTBBW1_1430031 [Desulfamplus magnetovallimortis]|uniref:Uncharacterized protein n=1 Tax=Desulfamplus magnetovallimortis TaxID=1246637 RepID=A0A1W1H863_9BACT|nr:hypothetical protein [Desulfamplus magnetovallimortis]SLM28659.1 hypothetical protein MTBBW1_1430031 [Desulfamplus magnetovallimortis]
MAIDNKVRKKILFGSLALLAVSVIYRILNPYSQPTVRELTYKQGDIISSEQANNKKTAKFDVAASLLDYKPQSYSVIRDPFNKPVSKDVASLNTPEEPETPEKTPEEDIVPEESHADIKEQEKQMAISAIVNGISDLRILGSCIKDGILSFFIKDGDIVTVIQKGTKIKDTYPVSDLTQDYILVNIPEFDEDVRINLKDFNGNRYL